MKSATMASTAAKAARSVRSSMPSRVGPVIRPAPPNPTQIRSLQKQSARNNNVDLSFATDLGSLPPYMISVQEEHKYLKDVVQRLPFVVPTAPTEQSEEFQFPLGTVFKADTWEMGLKLKDVYKVALKEYGIAAIELDFQDPDSNFILELVDSMGFAADTHSGNQGALWDVTYKPEGVPNLVKEGSTAHSISHSLGEFAWHTDGAFETNPQRYFGFHVIHPDKCGGGVFRLLKAEELVEHLSPSTVETLSSTTFDLRVPDEFFKGQRSVRGKLLSTDPTNGHTLLRFRRDILFDPPCESDAAANRAVGELAQLLERPEGVGKSVPAYAFKENMVLLMDNARFLHSRTDIKDPKRWLRRVRFAGKELAMQRRRRRGRPEMCNGTCATCSCPS